MKESFFLRHLWIATLLISTLACSLSSGIGGRASETLTRTLSPTGEPAETITPTLEPSPTDVPTLAPTPTAMSTPTLEPTPTSTLSGELKIGVIAPLTGKISSFGAANRNGIMLAVEEWNAKGGVLGMRVVPVFEDSQCDPILSKAAAKRLIEEEHVHYIIGDTCSKSSIAVSEVANSAGVIQVTPTSTNPLVTVSDKGQVKEYIFRACFIDSFQGILSARFAAENLSARTAFVMYDSSNEYVSSLAKAFITAYQDAGGKVVGRATYTLDNLNIPAILDQIEATSPDLVYHPDYFQVVGEVMAQAKNRGLTVPFMGGDGWDTNETALSAVYDGYFTNHFDLGDTDPLSAAFTANYAEKFSTTMANQHTDTIEAVMSYDTLNLLATAIQNAGADDAVLVKAALEAISFDAITGNITFDKNHDPIKPGVVIHVQNGHRSFFSRVTP